VKLHSVRSNQWLYVDWWLMNHCSWRCSYCHERLRNGTIELVGIRDCLRFVESVTAYARSNGKIVDFNFTGGEVTEWNEFPELVQRAKSLGNRVCFRTNANCDINTWQTLIKSVDSLNIDLHPEHTMISKFMLAVDRAVTQGVSVTVTANMMKDRWDELTVTLAAINEKYPQVRVNKRMLFEDPIVNTKPVDYDQQQLEEIRDQRGDLVFTDQSGDQRYTDYQTLVLESKNVFTKWRCDIGLEQIIVDAWGKIQRGHCRVGGKIGEITDDTIYWPSQGVTCISEVCRNAFDIQATKSLL